MEEGLCEYGDQKLLDSTALLLFFFAMSQKKIEETIKNAGLAFGHQEASQVPKDCCVWGQYSLFAVWDLFFGAAQHFC